MIKQVRRKFLLISIMALFLVLLALIGGVATVSMIRDDQEMNSVLTVLAKNNGNLLSKRAHKSFGANYKPDNMFKYRFFSVTVKNKTVSPKDMTHIYAIDDQQIADNSRRIVRQIKFAKRGKMRINGSRYAYYAVKKGSSYTVYFLDTYPLTSSTRGMIRLAIVIALVSLAFFTLLILAFSNRAIKPIILAYRKQQSFITNAGHELKTPLAIIAANTEMEEMLGKDDEWTKSTKEQVARLTDLINNLIRLARFAEKDELKLSRINFSEIAQKAADSFKSILSKDGKEYQVEIDPDLYVNAEPQTLYELCNILLDNAAKYCDDDGRVLVSLKPSKLSQTAVLTVKNSYAAGKNVDYSHFFERFYRADESHNSSKSGFGIGLSMASELTNAFGGKIKAGYDDGFFKITLSLRLKK